jgi:hypothetical protein
MIRNPSETLDSKPKNALFPLLAGWVSAGMHFFQRKKWIPFAGYFNEISGWVCSELSIYRDDSSSFSSQKQFDGLTTHQRSLRLSALKNQYSYVFSSISA